MNHMLMALEVQGRVIKALFLRELKTRFGEKRLGFLWAFGEPIIHVLTIVVIWKIFGRMGPQGLNPMLFLFTGVIPYIMFSNILNKVMHSISGNKALLVFPQVKPIDLIISRIVLEFTTYGVVFLFFISACAYLDMDFKVKNPLGVLQNFALMALLGGGMGYILMPLISLSKMVEQFARFLLRALYITSGVFFSIDRLPRALKQYMEWNPALQIMQMLRADFFPEMAMKPEFSNMPYILFLISAMWLFAMVLTARLMIYILDER